MDKPLLWRVDDIAGGQVLIGGTGIIAEVIVGRFAAGDSIASLAVDYDIPVERVEDAIRLVVACTFTKHRGLPVAVERRMEARVPLMVRSGARG